MSLKANIFFEIFVEVIKLRKSTRIENIMKKRMKAVQQTWLNLHCNHKVLHVVIKESKRDEIHGQSKEKCKN